MNRTAILLEATELSKSFGTLPVVQRVSLQIHPGEVVGLAGQSGAGKSALAMLLAGFYIPSGGSVVFDGQFLRWPFQARDLGIEVIHQQPDLAERLDISSNVFLGNEIGWSLLGRWLKVPNRRRMDAEAARILSELGMHVESLREIVANLSSEKRQVVALARALTHPAKLIILDDPTLLLGFRYQQRLLSLVPEWQRQGTAVLFASDNLDHLLAVTDRIVVLRHGRKVAEYRSDEADREEIVSAMVGTTDRELLTPIMWALDSYYRAREQAERLYQRQALLERDLGTQDTFNRELIDRLADQIDALDSANVALQNAQRRLLTQLEQERKGLAREIHDQIIQDLLGVNYRLEEIEVGRGIPVDLTAELASIQNNIRDLVDDLRHICGSLRPPTIDSLGLGPALQSYTRDWSERSGVPVTLSLDPGLARLPESIELSIFRVVQEALSNVHKHARAHAVQIRLEHTTPRTLMLSIADDGRGLTDDFDLRNLSADGHFGLLGISERVALLGGRSNMQNQAGGGFLVQAEIPHPRVAQPSEEVHLRP
jgi:signal transduction histidine kinase